MLRASCGRRTSSGSLSLQSAKHLGDPFTRIVQEFVAIGSMFLRYRLVHMVLDLKARLRGVEIIGASERLRPETLAAAERIDRESS
jgi:hypothetical protein